MHTLVCNNRQCIYQEEIFHEIRKISAVFFLEPANRNRYGVGIAGRYRGKEKVSLLASRHSRYFTGRSGPFDESVMQVPVVAPGPGYGMLIYVQRIIKCKIKRLKVATRRIKR